MPYLTVPMKLEVPVSVSFMSGRDADALLLSWVGSDEHWIPPPQYKRPSMQRIWWLDDYEMAECTGEPMSERYWETYP